MSAASAASRPGSTCVRGARSLAALALALVLAAGSHRAHAQRPTGDAPAVATPSATGAPTASAEPEPDEVPVAPTYNGPAERPFAQGAFISGRCPSAHRCLCFTFDDGPDAHLLRQLLDVLDRYHVRATFFVVGQRLEFGRPGAAANRAALRAAVRRGHLVGNHSYSHAVLDRLTPAQLIYEIDHTASLISDTIGVRPGFFRAPYGRLNTRGTISAVVGRGYTVTRWRIDLRDWGFGHAADVLANFRRQIARHPRGGVVLMHDIHPHTVAAVPLILDEVVRMNRELTARGEEPYDIVGLDALYRFAPRHHHAAGRHAR